MDTKGMDCKSRSELVSRPGRCRGRVGIPVVRILRAPKSDLESLARDLRSQSIQSSGAPRVGAGVFATSSFIRIPDWLVGRHRSIVVADFDNDANPDIVTTGYEAVVVLINDGKGSFLEPISIPIASTNGIRSVVTEDFDNDGLTNLQEFIAGT